MRAAVGAAALWLAGCGVFTRGTAVSPGAQPPHPPIYGTASWYGPGFDGHPTASGEIYNQEDLTAASTLFSLGTLVMVTNLGNGRSVEVRINDRGPFVKGRKIDLSRRAARTIGMIRPGTAPVRIDVVRAGAAGATLVGAPRYFVQVGSFVSRRHADGLYRRLARSYADVSVDAVRTRYGRYYRVRMGSFGSQSEARRRARSLRRLGLPLLVTSE